MWLWLRCKLGIHKWDFYSDGPLVFGRCLREECRFHSWAQMHDSRFDDDWGIHG